MRISILQALLSLSVGLRGKPKSPIETLDSVWKIDINDSPVYPHFKTAKKDLDYLGREMAKIGTRQIPKFKKRAEGTGWDNLDDDDLLSSNNETGDGSTGWYS